MLHMRRGNAAIVLIAIVAVIAAVAAWWYWAGEVAVQTETTEMSDTTGSQAPDTLPSGSATTDAALTEDLSTIDAQMNAFTADNSSIDSSLSDQSIEQSAL